MNNEKVTANKLIVIGSIGFQQVKQGYLAAVLLPVLFACFLLMPAAYAQSPTLQNVISNGKVVCGLNKGLKGFAQANSLGDYSGLFLIRVVEPFKTVVCQGMMLQ